MAPAVPLALTIEEARQQARAEGLTLLKAKNSTGYFGVSLDQRAKTKPYTAQVRRGGKQVTLGCFAIAEAAALCIARTPEGQAAAAVAPAAPPSDESSCGACLHVTVARLYGLSSIAMYSDTGLRTAAELHWSAQVHV